MTVNDRMYIAGRAVQPADGSWARQVRAAASGSRLAAEPQPEPDGRGESDLARRLRSRSPDPEAQRFARHRRRGAGSAKVLVPVAALGMLIGGVFMSLRGDARTWTVSDVTAELRQLAVDGGAGADPYAGTLGPMRIAAGSIDGATGDFLNFRIESDSLLVTAERATLQVDPVQDTFAFDLHVVTFTRLAPATDDDVVGADGAPGFRRPRPSGGLVHTTERHLFGPTPFGANIVPDGTKRRSAARPGFGPRGAEAKPSTDGPGWLRDAGSE